MSDDEEYRQRNFLLPFCLFREILFWLCSLSPGQEGLHPKEEMTKLVPVLSLHPVTYPCPQPQLSPIPALLMAVGTGSWGRFLCFDAFL